jgi:hypothetical protein
MKPDKATPRPWRFIDREELEDGSIYYAHLVGGSRDLVICSFGNSSNDDMAETKTDIRSKKANAALIVKAVNLHDELVVTLEKLLGTHSDEVAQGEAWMEAERVLAKAKELI